MEGAWSGTANPAFKSFEPASITTASIASLVKTEEQETLVRIAEQQRKIQL